jgi:hypothetical protein
MSDVETAWTLGGLIVAIVVFVLYFDHKRML